MAFRRPLKLNGSNLQEMSNAELDQWRERIRRDYIANPSVRLRVVGSGGNLGNLVDTRLQAGGGRSFSTRYPREDETAEPSIVAVIYSRLNQDIDSVAAPSSGGISYPVYYDGSNIRAMSLTDIYDTFIKTALNTTYTSIYHIHTSTSLSGWSLQSSTPVFSDTGANTGLYTAGGIYEALDQPYTRTNFYLFKRNLGAVSAGPEPVRIDGSNNLRAYNNFSSDLLNIARYASVNLSGYRNRYSWNGGGLGIGAAWDDRLNGSGNYQRRFVNRNDYRAQEFPNGAFTRISTYYLRSRLE